MTDKTMNEQREIIFRGKRIDTDEWVYGYAFKCPSSCYLIFIWNDISENFDGYGIHAKTVGQYTGLKDRSGTRIFDGDIFHTEVDGKVFTYFVAWINDGWCAVEAESKRYVSLASSWAELSIICGNIHDNPELLEDGK